MKRLERIHDLIKWLAETHHKHRDGCKGSCGEREVGYHHYMKDHVDRAVNAATSRQVMQIATLTEQVKQLHNRVTDLSNRHGRMRTKVASLHRDVLMSGIFVKTEDKS